MAESGFGATTPLGRWLEFFEALDAPLRAHLAPHVLRPELPVAIESADVGADAPRPGRTTLSMRLTRVARAPVDDAELAAALAERTDRALADATLRASWTGEDALRRAEEGGAPADLGIEDHLRQRRAEATSRSLEWMRACDAWARLRATGLARRRIERWREKHRSDGDRA